MNFSEEIKSYKIKIDALLREYLLAEKERARLVSSANEKIFDFVVDFCGRGGKRIRPILFIKGYEAVSRSVGIGGKDAGEIIRASISIELVEAYLLIHDDIIDEDSIRRGGPSFHRMAGEWRNEHFGVSAAIIAGDMLGGLANQIIMETSFHPELKLRAIRELISAEIECFHGELYDVVLEDEDEVKEEDFFKMVDLKTVSYTTVAPLVMGAILGKGSSKQIEAFRKYGKLLGRAFQVIDDILGTFGEEKRTGKPVGSDIRQGKKTLLLLYALSQNPVTDSFGVEENLQLVESSHRLLRSEDVEFLQHCIGNKDLKYGELQQVRKIFKDCGALEYSRNLATEYIKKAKLVLDSSDFKAETKEFLNYLANFIIERKL